MNPDTGAPAPDPELEQPAAVATEAAEKQRAEEEATAAEKRAEEEAAAARAAAEEAERQRVLEEEEAARVAAEEGRQDPEGGAEAEAEAGDTQYRDIYGKTYAARQSASDLAM